MNKHDAALFRALHSFANAEGRWARRVEGASGMTDDELRYAIAAEFGEHGGCAGPGITYADFRGGKNPRITLGRHDDPDQETLSGKALLSRVRKLLNIPFPKKTPTERLNEMVASTDTAPAAEQLTEQQSTALARLPQGGGLAVYDRIQNVTDFVQNMGKVFAESRMFGCQNVQQGQVMVLTCLTERMTPKQFACTYHLIDGKLSMRADAMLAEYRRRGGKCRWVNTGDDGQSASAVFTFDGNEMSVTYSLEDARRAKLIKSGGAWEKDPGAMLRARCVSKAIRMIAPEIVAGAYTPEELEEPATGEPNDNGNSNAPSVAVNQPAPAPQQHRGRGRPKKPSPSAPAVPLEPQDSETIDAEHEPVGSQPTAAVSTPEPQPPTQPASSEKPTVPAATNAPTAAAPPSAPLGSPVNGETPLQTIARLKAELNVPELTWNAVLEKLEAPAKDGVRKASLLPPDKQQKLADWLLVQWTKREVAKQKQSLDEWASGKAANSPNAVAGTAAGN